MGSAGSGAGWDTGSANQSQIRIQLGIATLSAGSAKAGKSTDGWQTLA